MIRLLCLLLGCISQSLAGTINGQIVANPKLQVPSSVDQASLLSSAKVLLVKDGVTVASTAVSTRGGFLIPAVESGKYVAFFTHPFFRIDPVTVEVDGESVRVSVYDPIRTGPGAELAYPLKVTPAAYQSPYVPEEEFNAFQILKNPMAIMGVVMLALVYIMPKLQGGVSQEEMSDMRKSLAEDGGMAASFLKKMIPSESSGAAAQGAVGAIPSIATKKQQ